MRIHHSKGITAVEILVASVVFAVMIAAGFSVYRTINQNSNRRDQLDIVKSTVLRAHSRVLFAAQAARNCLKVTVGTESFLECEKPHPINPMVRMRVRLVSTALEIQEEQTAGTWTTVEQIPAINSFVLCNDTDMAGAGCPLGGAPLNQLHTANVAGRANRFFRFRLGATAALANGKVVSTNGVNGAFYVRNPVPGTTSSFY